MNPGAAPASGLVRCAELVESTTTAEAPPRVFRLLTTVWVGTSHYDVTARFEDRADIGSTQLMAGETTHFRLQTDCGSPRHLHLRYAENDSGDLPLPRSLLIELRPDAPTAGSFCTEATLAALAAALEEALESRPFNARLVSHIALAMRALMTVDVESAPASASHPRLYDWQLRRAIAIMDERFSEALRIPDIAAACSLSPSYFGQAFLAKVGKTPYRWLVDRRVQAARHLLLTTDMSLTEVGAACGFAEQTHFTRSFRNNVGMPPGSWRRSRTSLDRDQARS